MARPASLQKGQWDQFDRLLNSTDLQAEEVLKLIEHPKVLGMMLATMRMHPDFNLVHNVFRRQDDVLAAFKTHHEAKGIDFGKFSWVGSKTAPEFDPNDPETAVVLDATHDTLQSTFEFVWAWTVDGQDDKHQWEGMVSDSKKLRLLSDEREADAEGDSPEFKPWTLAWRRIKLDVNVGKRPIDVRNVKTSPGCALLFMSAEHPARIKAIDYETRFGFWLPGLKCTAPGGRTLCRVPYVHFDRVRRRVGLDSRRDDRSGSHLTVPAFRE